MKYVNPIELLELEELDANEIKKAKRRKFAEIELSDDKVIEYGDAKISRSDLIKLTDELENPFQEEFHVWIKWDRLLSNFLHYGNTKFFEEKILNSKYRSKKFLQFITPFFSYQYDKAFKKAFINGDVYTIRLLIQNSPLIEEGSEDKLFKSSVRILEETIAFIEALNRDIENDVGEFDEAQEYVKIIDQKINISLLNSLPNYFEGLRNQIAQKGRNLAVAIFNCLDDVDESLNLLEKVLKIKVYGLSKTNLEKDLEQLINIKEEREFLEKYAGFLEKYAAKTVLIKRIISALEEKEISFSKTKKMLKGSINVNELNGLPELFDNIRNQIAIGLKSISVEVWNQFSELKYSIALVQFAKKIEVSFEVKDILEDALFKLDELKESIKNNAFQEVSGVLAMCRKVNTDVAREGLGNINQAKLLELVNFLFDKDLITQLKKSENRNLFQVQLFSEIKKLCSAVPKENSLAIIRIVSPVLSHENNSVSIQIRDFEEEQNNRGIGGFFKKLFG